ncbi:MAG: hypothetical protein EXR38_00970 [Methylotenera sp.]|nr:hypothetical protein [Methylotenera sp.]MSP99080.1 hypothetical protein [Methylotenera sp.]
MKVQQLILCLSALSFGSAMAGPADYMYSPTVELGEKEIDFKFGTAKQQDGTRKTVSSLGFGYGATEYWFTELYLKSERQAGDGLALAEWENKFQLTETGKYVADLGLIVELEAPLNNGQEPWEFKIGPLFQTEFGKLQLNGNVLFERKFGPKDADDHYNTEMGYQWQVKYRMKAALEFGAQGFGEMGEWNHWDNSSMQNHRFGPAVFGKLALGNKRAVKYNAAWLLGVSEAAPNNTVRMQLEYEF